MPAATSHGVGMPQLGDGALAHACVAAQQEEAADQAPSKQEQHGSGGVRKSRSLQQQVRQLQTTVAEVRAQGGIVAEGPPPAAHKEEKGKAVGTNTESRAGRFASAG